MPQTEPRSSNKQPIKSLQSTIAKDAFNPFPEKYESNYCINKSKKLSPKVPKKTGKCFQLILICQKLLKPFSSSHKMCDSGSKKINHNHKEKSKSTPQININDRCSNVLQRKIFLHNNSCKLKVHRTLVPVEKVDASVQTNIPSISDGSHLLVEKAAEPSIDSAYFLKEDEIQMEDYWDLDIDSAIVGDYNSVSEMSLDEQIDPHYAKIKLPNDGKSEPKYDCVSDASIFNTSLVDRSNSNASSPQSGIYSKINKFQKRDESRKHKLPDYNHVNAKSNSKLNFEHIVMIKNQLGLSHEMYAFDDDSKLNFPTDEITFYPSFVHSNDTPDLPKRNYGSSVINFITKLREEKDSNHSFINQPAITKSSWTANSDDISRINNIYSPIWYMKRKVNHSILHREDTPASEPTMPRRSNKMIFDHLNPIFKDDSSEEASSISFYSPLKNKYSYPRNFSESHSMKQFLEHPYDNIDKGILVDQIRMFRHVDSEVDISVSQNCSEQNDLCVPLDFKRGDLCYTLEDKLFLEPLMERSYEEDYFLRDISSSLEYINV